jgi:SAM-dependent methyltransferase
MLERFVPKEPTSKPGMPGRWLDVLPCTGILTERMARERPRWTIDVVERTPEVAAFCAKRVRPPGAASLWPEGEPAPPGGAYDLATCLFRLENLAAAERDRLFNAMAQWLRPGGKLVVGFVNARSFHDLTERLRARRGGPKGVEYVLSPDPNIGPFEALDPARVLALARAAGFELVDRFGTQAAPAPEEIEFRTRNFRPRTARLARAAAATLGLVARVPGVETARGRFRFLELRKLG